jgi:hypothetical protein
MFCIRRSVRAEHLEPHLPSFTLLLWGTGYYSCSRHTGCPAK